eukprot:TRINITY_DN7034_c0_g2_i1.p1 TRINITY_DN7034_c0_g2~~TRINITY_DN7034_c0_g2_i1.p1  ORF type:complete len:223 (+),score=45.89 TRINITY_DN7034_c0_g2_i1:215-883(+)
MTALLFLLLIGTAAATIRISCVGDSITVGVCSSTTHGYPAVLQSLLGDEYEVSNFGVSGTTMLKKGVCGPPPDGDCAYWDTATYTAAVNSTPDIVTIMLGTNDAKQFNWVGVQDQGDSFVTDYISMINVFKNLSSNPKIYLMIPPPLYPPFPYNMSSTVINQIFPQMIPKLAAQTNVGVIDVFDALGGANLTQPGITCDGCHPVDKGYMEIAATMYKVITGA